MSLNKNAKSALAIAIDCDIPQSIALGAKGSGNGVNRPENRAF
jgi:hypothetical protein